MRMLSVAAASKLPDCVWIVPEDSTRIFVSQTESYSDTLPRYQQGLGLDVKAHDGGSTDIWILSLGSGC